MFVDKVQVMVRAGHGGNGVVSFRHEIYVDRGGPDGGDGGNGGDVILEGSRNQDTLAAFRYQKLLSATDGQNGSKQKKHGRAGDDLVIQIPVGTVITSEDGAVVADITQDGQKFVLAHGGKGGFGNAHFISSTRQTPRLAEKGEDGEELTATFELKMLADVGLVGLPNAGKSTFLATVSNAKPEIADYPFTTLRPNLGVVDIDRSTSVLMADIPGLIEGASQGKGLGDEFLRHVERTSVLLHLIDAYQNDVAEAYKTIQGELKSYSVDLSKRPQLVLLNKIDGLDSEILADKMSELKKVVKRGTPLFAISAKSGQGVKELMYEVKKAIVKHRLKVAKEPEKLPVITLQTDDNWRVEKVDGGFIVRGSKIERFAARTDFDSAPAVQRLRDIMKKMGIMRELVKKGIEADQTITIGDKGSLPY